MNISQITNNIYLGGLGFYTTDIIKNYLIENNIKSIITIWDLKKLDIDKLNINKEDYLYIHAYDLDEEEIIQYFDITYNFIKEKIKQNKKILIHCFAGVSRSASIVINYLITDNNISVEDAIKIVLKKRNIRPNSYFINQLKAYSGYYDRLRAIMQ
ncbi:protein tyrosine phosphatase 2 [Mythimna separata entomopoxvirus 'L']|uniref:Protein tyrosine phosphatase 2 n=1 Tax=Mythimna separata entomopoxvirus 'L' TaxID=1293572 RepID=A0A916KQ50_9POXV|nr:protein tyrosine phosphatase 2 [Mythimna separata entomopoxvirus 'L']CCU56296.1 protein tyrosine phosphatase 2 [Mythimna separata entomopoxvirus 'L']